MALISFAIKRPMNKRNIFLQQKKQCTGTRFINVRKLNTRQETILKRGLPKKRAIEGVKNIVLVSSAKGGVGKSTVAVNLAIAMNRFKKISVGLLDADIYGPSIPKLMNLSGNPQLSTENKMIPLLNYNIPCISMGFLVDEKAPFAWRGLMVMQAIEKLLRQVEWSNIDYLIIDMPPGTGDVQLTISQSLPVKGTVLICTPQDIALHDTRRGAEMYTKFNIPILGLIQNMAFHSCLKCGHTSHIFGYGKLETLCKEMSWEILGNIPLTTELSECSDMGIPIMVKDSDSLQGQIIGNIASKILKKVQETY